MGNERECAGELFARMHLLLYNAGHLPLRDQIFMDQDDNLGRVFMERSKRMASADDDWNRMIAESLGHVEPPVATTESQENDRLVPVAHPLQVDRRQLAKFVREVHPI